MDETDYPNDEALKEQQPKAFIRSPQSGGGMLGPERPTGYWTGFDLYSYEDKKMILRMRQGCDLNAQTIGRDNFQICNVYCHEVDLADEKTGELTRQIRTALLLNSGKTLAFVSQGVFSSIGDIVSMMGHPPWNPPLQVKLVERFTSKKFRILFLELV